MGVDSSHSLFRAIFDHDAELVRGILTDHPDLVNAWMAGSNLWSDKFEGKTSDSRGFEASEGLDPLGYAVACDAIAIVDLLIQFGANTESLNYDGNMGWCSPIVLAAFGVRTEIVSLLVERGASLNSVSSAGQSALMTAAEHGRTVIADILSAAGAEMTIHAAAALGRVQEVDRILSGSRAWLEAKDAYRQATPIFYAAGSNRVDALKFLAHHGANTNQTDHKHWTPLIMAGYSGCNGAVLALAELGADVNHLVPSGRWGLEAGSNVLHAICLSEESTPEAVGILIDKGADTSIRNIEGQRPVDIARAKSNSELVKALSD